MDCLLGNVGVDKEPESTEKGPVIQEITSECVDTIPVLVDSIPRSVSSDVAPMSQSTNFDLVDITKGPVSVGHRPAFEAQFVDKTPVLEPETFKVIQTTNKPKQTFSQEQTDFIYPRMQQQAISMEGFNPDDLLVYPVTTSESIIPSVDIKAADRKMEDPTLLNSSMVRERNASMLWKLNNFPTMFSKISEKNVTFCIDTSGSMYNCLQVVKDHVIETLFQKATADTESHFNLVEFSTQVTQWSDKQVRCSSQTVAIAAQWISKLEATTGTNMLDALLSAFSDSNCASVYLITDGKPDQHPSEILDNVAYIAQNRPVHCYYMQTDEPDQPSIDFLQELAYQTYGSFHVISVTQSGAIEKIVPIYRAEASAERIIRTTEGTVYPSAEKRCSVSTTLNHPPNVYFETTPNIVVQEVDPWYPFLPYPYYAGWPVSYYKQYSYKSGIPYNGGWSKWRPARAWSKFTQNLSDASQLPPPAPGPGAMLIGIRILARRNTDGYFYLGSVKSQILQNKFLIEFGPCKHGKYKDTSYQETFVYDMVSHADALRHSVVPGDKVLAPWEPEGERYGPGLVLEGQEKRMAEGGSFDSQLVVSFHNGKTATVPLNTAIWVPVQLYERIKFELQLPSTVRKEFAEQDQYPEDNLPGYPTSDIRADPDEFTKYDPTSIKGPDHSAVERGIYDNPYYVPMYPVYYKYQPRPSAVNSEEVDVLVPGTDLTKTQLNEKVMCQLMQYKMSLENKKEQEEERQRLLYRRSKVGENTLKKSVSFHLRDNLSDVEAEFYSGDLEMKDSGHGSATDLELENIDDDEYKITRDIGVGTNSKLLYPPKKRSCSPSKPRWQYWGSDPAPEMTEPMHFGPYRIGPYDATVAAAPLELRNKRVNNEDMQWSSTMYQYVDPYAKINHEGNSTVKDAFGYVPHPPGPKPEKQGPGRDMCDVIGEHQRERDRLAESRLDYRRQQCLARDAGLQVTREEKRAMKQIMRDQHKQQILAQLERDKQRHLSEIERVEHAREAKKQINTQIRIKIESNQHCDKEQQHERQREEQRQAALQNRRARREEILAQRQSELEEVRLSRKAYKEERSQVRHQAVTDKLNAQDAMVAARDAQARQANISRLEHFRQKEENNQQRKALERQLKGNTNAVFRSIIIP